MILVLENVLIVVQVKKLMQQLILKIFFRICEKIQNGKFPEYSRKIFQFLESLKSGKKRKTRIENILHHWHKLTTCHTGTIWNKSKSMSFHLFQCNLPEHFFQEAVLSIFRAIVRTFMYDLMTFFFEILLQLLLLPCLCSF